MEKEKEIPRLMHLTIDEKELSILILGLMLYKEVISNVIVDDVLINFCIETVIKNGIQSSNYTSIFGKLLALLARNVKDKIKL